MKKKIMYMFIFILGFLSFSSKAFAEGYELVCEYLDKDKNVIEVSYYSDGKEYLFEYRNGKDEWEGNIKSMKASAIKADINGFSVMEPALIVDENVLEDFTNTDNKACPSYAYWDFDKKDFCFSDNTSYCNNISGYDFVLFSKATDYTSKPVTTKLSCERGNDGQHYDVSGTNFKIEIDSLDKVNIYYEKNSSWVKLGNQVRSFNVTRNTGTTASVNFYNENLSSPISGRLAFDNLYKSLTKNYTSCPGIKFANQSGNYYVYLENSFNDEYIYSTNGGKEDNTDANKPYEPIDSNVDSNLNFEAGDTCESFLGRSDNKEDPAYYLHFAFNLMKYAAIILLLALTVMDFFKAVTSQNQDALKKALQATVKRLIIAVVIFFLPMLVEFLFELFGIYTDPSCVVGGVK